MNVKLYNDDCLNVLKEIDDNSIDLVLTDPPYGTTACKWDNVIPFDAMWEQLKRVIKPHGAIVLFGSEPFSSLLRCSNLSMFKYDWIWEKSKSTGFLNSKKQPLRSHEVISVFYKKQPTYNPQMVDGKPYDKGIRKPQSGNDVYGNYNQHHILSGGNRYPRSVQYFRTAESEGGYHKTQKPVALLEYLIKTYTNEGETVLDFTAGSMSTAIACINTNRKGIMIEMDKHYFKIGSERVAKASKEKQGQTLI